MDVLLNDDDVLKVFEYPRLLGLERGPKFYNKDGKKHAKLTFGISGENATHMRGNVFIDVVLKNNGFFKSFEVQTLWVDPR